MGEADEGSVLEHQARERFGELEPAEIALLRALPLGEKVDCAIRKGVRPAGGCEIRAKLIRWICVNATAQGRHADPRGIRISDAEIVGELNLSSLSVSSPLSFSYCNFDHVIEITGAELKGLSLEGSQTQGVSADGVRVNGDLTLDSGFVANGSVHLRGANITGSLKCDDGKFDKGNGAVAVDFSGAKVSANVRLSTNFHSVGPVLLVNAKIDGHLDCSGWSFFNNHVDTSLDATGASIGGNVYLSSGFRSEGTVRFSNAEIGGNLLCDDGHFKNVHAPALNLNGTRIGGAIYLGSGFRSEGEVSAVSVEVNSNFSCAGGNFANERGPALNADGAKVRGAVFFTTGFDAQGEVRLVGANVGSQLLCSGGHFRNPMARALNAHEAVVTGSVVLTHGFLVDGNVELTAMTVGGDVRLSDADLCSEKGTIVNCGRTTVKGELVCSRNKKNERTNLRLRGASITVLHDDADSWPDPGNLDLNGLVYKSINGESPTDAKSRLKWLRLQLPRAAFHAQPYKQLAKVLRENGQEKEARSVLIGFEHDRDRFESFSPLARIGRIIYRLFGYGYKPHIGAFVLAAVLFFAGWVFVALADHNGMMILTEKINSGTASDKHLSPFLYSIDTLLPIHAFHQADSWWPAGEKWELFKLWPITWPWHYLLQLWFCFQIFAGWILTGMIVAGFAGVVRRE